METDCRGYISTAFAWIREANPSSVLDVGVVFGKWGFLCREHLDAWRDSRGRDGQKPRLVGINGSEPLHSDARCMYDDILVGDVLERIHDVGLFDLVMVSDLEHLTRVQADCMLVNASAIAKAVLIVATSGRQPHGDGRERRRTAIKFRHVRGMFRVLRHQTFEDSGRGYWMALLEGQQARAAECVP